MTCNHCGKCCHTVILALHHTPIANDKQELGRWLSYHGCTPLKIFNGKEDVLAVKIPSKCEHLKKLWNGKYTCKIYENRPQICKDHWCQEHNLQELVNKTALELEGKCITSLLKG